MKSEIACYPTLADLKYLFYTIASAFTNLRPHYIYKGIIYKKKNAEYRSYYTLIKRLRLDDFFYC